MIYRCEPAKHLFILTPSHTFWNTCETTMTVVRGINALTRAGVTVSFGIAAGAAYPDHAYNACVDEFRKSDATDLLIIDYDVGTPSDSFIRIARSERPVTVGAYPKKKSPTSWTVDFPENRFRMDKEGYAYPELAPTGFTRFNRAVFDILPYTKYIGDDGEPIRGYFHTEIREGRKYRGCDNLFCEKWLEMGGEISMIPDLYFTHSGMHTWSGNFLEYVKNLQAGFTDGKTDPAD